MFLTVVIMFNGCGFKEVPTMLLDPDEPSLVPYKQRYLTSLKFVTGFDFSDAASEVQISFSDELNASKLGRCSRYKVDNRIIGRVVRISTKWWPSMSEYSREQLIWHEMGHCMLDKGHEDFIYQASNGNIPGSIMNSYHINQSVYLANKAYYISQYINAGPIYANRIVSDTIVAQLNASFGKLEVESTECYDH